MTRWLPITAPLAIAGVLLPLIIAARWAWQAITWLDEVFTELEDDRS